LPYAVDRYTNEAKRIYNVIDKRVSETPYLSGEHSIADMATYPWLRTHNWQGQNLEDFPSLKRWYEAIEARPGVQRGLAVMKDEVERARQNPPDKSSWDILFGKQQFEKR
jgi:GSH-dependent disulfide-bond oxidoreductase